MQSFAQAVWGKLRLPCAAGVGLVVLLALVRWGGAVDPGPAFYVGVAFLSGLVLAFALLIWWLFLSPLPVAPRATPLRSVRSRQILALLVLFSGMLFVVGGFWDEVWHRRYGGFGDDFLWPPHIMLYGSVGLIALFAAGGLLTALGRGSARGGMRQRFRADPLVGLLGLVSVYLVASLPSDQIWHVVYGSDITAWSLPHILLTWGFALVMLAAVTIPLSLLPRAPWRGLRGLQPPEALALGLIAWAMVILLQVGAAEWDGLTTIGGGGDRFRQAFWERPEWLYPVVLVGIAVFSGVFALHALRRAGAATLTGLLTLAFRVGAIVAMDAGTPDVRMGFGAHVLILPPLLALDLWYAARSARAASFGTLVGGSLVASAVCMAVGLPYIARTMIYPRINDATLPGMIGWGLIVALGAGWAGARLGAWLGAFDRARPASAHSALDLQ